MTNSDYISVHTNSDSEENKNKCTSWKPFARQLLICSGIWMSVFLYGLGVGAPTVFIPQIRKESNSSQIITDDMASWLPSIYGFSGIPFVLILSIFTRYTGRKLPFVISCADSLIAFTILYFSTNITQIVVCQIMQGLFSASQIVVTVVMLTEYISPKYRGIFLTIKSATFYWGVLMSNAIGTFYHWKTIPLFGIFCACFTLLTVFMWPESPYWLASTGKFEQCARSHRWLKGTDEESEKELEILINSKKEYISSCQEKKLSIKEQLVDLYSTFGKVEFYKPTLLSILCGSLGLFSGKLVCAIYAIDIIKKITSEETTAYTGMLVLDGITVLSMYSGSILSKYFKRRTLLLVLSSIGVIFLFTISLYLYLVSLNVITENKYVSISLLTAFSIAVSSGPLVMSLSVYGELIPIRARNLSVCIIALTGKLVTAVCIKVAPYIFKGFGLHGAFLTFGILTSICICLLYKYLPETKDKTLQEIEYSMKGTASNHSTTNQILLNKR